MVTSHHEVAHRIFQDRPELLPPVFNILGIPLPENPAVEVLTPDVTEVRPVERRVDSVLRIKPPGSREFLLAVEAQEKKDRTKGAAWAYYLSYLRAKYDQPALLLVVCQDRSTASWATGPFKFGLTDWTALSVHPLVLGPGNVPVIKDPEEAAQDVALASFSALMHGRDPDVPAILEAVARALGKVDPKSAAYYDEMLDIGLGKTPAGKMWRNLMGSGIYFPGHGSLIEEKYLEGEAKGKAEGKAEGEVKGRAEERAQMILRVLAKRQVPIPDSTRHSITDCTDLDMLGRWLDRAFTATTVEDLFTEQR